MSGLCWTGVQSRHQTVLGLHAPTDRSSFSVEQNVRTWTNIMAHER